MNKHNNTYFVLFGNDRYSPADHFKACRNKFDSLAAARAYVKNYTNAYIFKAHFPADQDIPNISPIN